MEQTKLKTAEQVLQESYEKDLVGTIYMNWDDFKLGHSKMATMILSAMEAYATQRPTVAPSYSAQALAEEAWRMLPDSCKEIMKGSVEQTWKESLVADIEHAFKTKGE